LLIIRIEFYNYQNSTNLESILAAGVGNIVGNIAAPPPELGNF